MDPEEFRSLGHRVVDWIADYRQSVARRPVMSRVAPGDVRGALPHSAPAEGESFEAIIADLERVIVPGLTHWQHPGFFAYFPSNASLASVLGDYLSSGLGTLGLSWQSSPALTELEEVVVDWFRQMVDLSVGWSGVIQDTASTSTLVALLCARERATRFSSSRQGVRSVARPLVAYASSQAHSSVGKAVTLAGIGQDHLRFVPHDDRYAMRPDALAAQIERDVAEGYLPCAIIATCGTTTTTALDPIEEIAVIAEAHGAWLHVDAALAGSAMILPECRWMWRGIERADSLVINAHKWLGAVFDCSLYYVRDPQHLVRVMSTNPSYLRTATDGEVNNLRDWGLPLGRRFRALKLWCLLRTHGVTALQARLRRDLDNAQWLRQRVLEGRGWRVVAPTPLQTVCVRHEPPGCEGTALDEHTLAWVDRVNRSGEAYVTPAVLDGRWMVRLSVGAERTERHHVAALWELLQRMAEGGD
jgi:aromatic-L-amino-acid decarboxylase